ncbi:MAG TPA: protein-methionine-sulfoxide reductase heme-binding subunit MsrQ [Nitrospiria bacterium]|nr:protein-methionine-sulfoxide reductase heme-binding subunit MsrQ [Nitrospiria bacterium]
MPRVARHLPFIVGCAPLGLLVWDAVTGGLGANPINQVIRSTGFWALVCLAIALASAPMGRILRWEGALVWRRTFGLMAFLYAFLHTAAYVGLDQVLSIADIATDVARRPHITVGLLSFVLLVPLALTSFGGLAERLGERRWHGIHQLVYPAAALGVVHHLLIAKVDTGAPFVFAVIFTGLFAIRMWYLLPRQDRRRRERFDQTPHVPGR